MLEHGDDTKATIPKTLDFSSLSEFLVATEIDHSFHDDNREAERELDEHDMRSRFDWMAWMCCNLGGVGR